MAGTSKTPAQITKNSSASGWEHAGMKRQQTISLKPLFERSNSAGAVIFQASPPLAAPERVQDESADERSNVARPAISTLFRPVDTEQDQHPVESAGRGRRLRRHSGDEDTEGAQAISVQERFHSASFSNSWASSRHWTPSVRPCRASIPHRRGHDEIGLPYSRSSNFPPAPQFAPSLRRG